MEEAISKAPAAPDPYATAAAQTGANQKSAEYNAALNRVNTNSPLGSSKYTVTGTDPSGAPLYQQDISLSPGQQHLYDTQLAQNNNIADLGNALTGQIGKSINTSIDGAAGSEKAASDAYYGKEAAYLDPQFKQSQSDLEAKLANEGVVQGSQAYTRAQGDQDRARTFAYDQAQQGAILHGVDAQHQAIANQEAVRAAPINELSAIRSGQQVQMPSFQSTAQANTDPANIAGLIENNYNQQVAASNNFNSGLFSLGGAAVSAFTPGAKASDRRLKRNIVRVGSTRVLGLPVYEYDYVWGGKRQRGVMADEVRRVLPQAVIRTASGYDAVNYGLIG